MTSVKGVLDTDRAVDESDSAMGVEKTTESKEVDSSTETTDNIEDINDDPAKGTEEVDGSTETMDSIEVVNDDSAKAMELEEANKDDSNAKEGDDIDDK